MPDIKIHLENAGRRYQRHWIFRRISYQFDSPDPYAILGSNGSGKSTLLKVLSGFLSLSEGNIRFTDGKDEAIPPELIYQQVALATPYLELPEILSLQECWNFHSSIQEFNTVENAAEFSSTLGLKADLDRPLKFYSSGMKQRVKLGFAFLRNTPLLLLDEPTSNLDRKGIEWFEKMMEKTLGKRLIIICSNSVQEETNYCKHQLDIEAFK